MIIRSERQTPSNLDDLTTCYFNVTVRKKCSGERFINRRSKGTERYLETNMSSTHSRGTYSLSGARGSQDVCEWREMNSIPRVPHASTLYLLYTSTLLLFHISISIYSPCNNPQRNRTLQLHALIKSPLFCAQTRLFFFPSKCTFRLIFHSRLDCNYLCRRDRFTLSHPSCIV